MKKNFVDQVRVTLSSGRGGRGSVHFHTNARVSRGGPDGGDGGDGGALWLKADERLWDLSAFKHLSHKAEDGKPGERGRRKGAKGKDLVLSVPLHTCCYDLEGQLLWEELGPKPVLLLKGGRGGKGNAFFKSARRQAPRTAQEGEKPQKKEVILEMKWPSHLALIGLRGAGKSQLISHCHAYLKSQDSQTGLEQDRALEPSSLDKNLNQGYSTPPFKKRDFARWSGALDPQLFVLNRPPPDQPLVVVDLPGINFFGQAFLRQAEKAKALLFVISLKDKEPFLSYQQLIQILKAYDDQQKSHLNQTGSGQVLPFEKDATLAGFPSYKVHIKHEKSNKASILLTKPRLLLLKGEKTAENIKKEQAFSQKGLFLGVDSAHKICIKKISFFSENRREDMEKLLSLMDQV